MATIEEVEAHGQYVKDGGQLSFADWMRADQPAPEPPEDVPYGQVDTSDWLSVKDVAKLWNVSTTVARNMLKDTSLNLGARNKDGEVIGVTAAGATVSTAGMIIHPEKAKGFATQKFIYMDVKLDDGSRVRETYTAGETIPGAVLAAFFEVDVSTIVSWSHTPTKSGARLDATGAVSDVVIGGGEDAGEGEEGGAFKFGAETTAGPEITADSVMDYIEDPWLKSDLRNTLLEKIKNPKNQGFSMPLRWTETTVGGIKTQDPGELSAGEMLPPFEGFNPVAAPQYIQFNQPVSDPFGKKRREDEPGYIGSEADAPYVGSEADAPLLAVIGDTPIKETEIGGSQERKDAIQAEGFERSSVIAKRLGVPTSAVTAAMKRAREDVDQPLNAEDWRGKEHPLGKNYERKSNHYKESDVVAALEKYAPEQVGGQIAQSRPDVAELLGFDRKDKVGLDYVSRLIEEDVLEPIYQKDGTTLKGITGDSLTAYLAETLITPGRWNADADGVFWWLEGTEITSRADLNAQIRAQLDDEIDDVLSSTDFREQYNVSSSQWEDLTSEGGLFYDPERAKGDRWKIDAGMQTAFTSGAGGVPPGTGDPLSSTDFKKAYLGYTEDPETPLQKRMNTEANNQWTALTSEGGLFYDPERLPGETINITRDMEFAYSEAVGAEQGLPEIAGGPAIAFDKKGFMAEYGVSDTEFGKLVVEGGALYDPNREPGDPYNITPEMQNAFISGGAIPRYDFKGPYTKAQFLRDNPNVNPAEWDFLVSPEGPFAELGEIGTIGPIDITPEMVDAFNRYEARPVAGGLDPIGPLGNQGFDLTLEDVYGMDKKQRKAFKDDLKETGAAVKDPDSGNWQYPTEGLADTVTAFNDKQAAIAADDALWGSATEVAFGDQLFSAGKVKAAADLGIFGQPGEEGSLVRVNEQGHTEYRIDAVMGRFDPFTKQFLDPNEKVPVGFTRAQMTEGMKASGMTPKEIKAENKTLDEAINLGALQAEGVDEDTFGKRYLYQEQIDKPGLFMIMPEYMYPLTPGLPPGTEEEGPPEPTGFLPADAATTFADASGEGRPRFPLEEVEEPEPIDRGRRLDEIAAWYKTQIDPSTGLEYGTAAANNRAEAFAGQMVDNDGLSVLPKTHWLSRLMNGQSYEKPVSEKAWAPIGISRIPDADTVYLDNGQAARVVGFDAPEFGDVGFAESTASTQAFFDAAEEAWNNMTPEEQEEAGGASLQGIGEGGTDDYNRALIGIRSPGLDMTLSEWYRFHPEAQVGVSDETDPAAAAYNDAIFKQYRGAVRDHEVEDIEATRTIIEGLDLSEAELASRGLSNPEDFDTFEDKYEVHHWADQYEQYKNDKSPGGTALANEAVGELATMGYDDPDLMIEGRGKKPGTAEKKFDWNAPYIDPNISGFIETEDGFSFIETDEDGVPILVPTDDELSPSEEYAQRYAPVENPFQARDPLTGEGTGLYIDKQTNWSAYVAAIASKNEKEWKRIESAWSTGPDKITQPGQRATDQQLETAGPLVDGKKGNWGIMDEGHARRIPGLYKPLDRSWFSFGGLPSNTDRNVKRIEEGDYEIGEELKESAIQIGLSAAFTGGYLTAKGISYKYGLPIWKIPTSGTGVFIKGVGYLVYKGKQAGQNMWDVVTDKQGREFKQYAGSVADPVNDIAGKVAAGEPLTDNEVRFLVAEQTRANQYGDDVFSQVTDGESSIFQVIADAKKGHVIDSETGEMRLWTGEELDLNSASIISSKLEAGEALTMKERNALLSAADNPNNNIFGLTTGEDPLDLLEQARKGNFVTASGEEIPWGGREPELPFDQPTALDEYNILDDPDAPYVSQQPDVAFSPEAFRAKQAGDFDRMVNEGKVFQDSTPEEIAGYKTQYLDEVDVAMGATPTGETVENAEQWYRQQRDLDEGLRSGETGAVKSYWDEGMIPAERQVTVTDDVRGIGAFDDAPVSAADDVVNVGPIRENDVFDLLDAKLASGDILTNDDIILAASKGWLDDAAIDSIAKTRDLDPDALRNGIIAAGKEADADWIGRLLSSGKGLLSEFVEHPVKTAKKIGGGILDGLDSADMNDVAIDYGLEGTRAKNKFENNDNLPGGWEVVESFPEGWDPGLGGIFNTGDKVLAQDPGGNWVLLMQGSSIKAYEREKSAAADQFFETGERPQVSGVLGASIGDPDMLMDMWIDQGFREKQLADISEAGEAGVFEAPPIETLQDVGGGELGLLAQGEIIPERADIPYAGSEIGAPPTTELGGRIPLPDIVIADPETIAAETPILADPGEITLPIEAPDFTGSVPPIAAQGAEPGEKTFTGSTPPLDIGGIALPGEQAADVSGLDLLIESIPPLPPSGPQRGPMPNVGEVSPEEATRILSGDEIDAMDQVAGILTDENIAILRDTPGLRRLEVAANMAGVDADLVNMTDLNALLGSGYVIPTLPTGSLLESPEATYVGSEADLPVADAPVFQPTPDVESMTLEEFQTRFPGTSFEEFNLARREKGLPEIRLAEAPLVAPKITGFGKKRRGIAPPAIPAGSFFDSPEQTYIGSEIGALERQEVVLGSLPDSPEATYVGSGPDAPVPGIQPLAPLTLAEAKFEATVTRINAQPTETLRQAQLRLELAVGNVPSDPGNLQIAGLNSQPTAEDAQRLLRPPLIEIRQAPPRQRLPVGRRRRGRRRRR